jgi:acyl carrier protein
MKKLKPITLKEVRFIINDVFRIGKIKPKKYDSENIQNWDSLGHMILLEKIEIKFGTKIKSKDIGLLQSEKEITKYLKKIK